MTTPELRLIMFRADLVSIRFEHANILAEYLLCNAIVEIPPHL